MNCGDGISWQRGKILWKGSYAMVFMGISESKYSCFPEHMAIKSGEVSKSISIQKEKQILNILSNNCSHINNCFGEEITFDKNGVMVYNLLLEYCSGRTLSDRIKNIASVSGSQGLSESETKYHKKSLLLGLKYIHEIGYVHRDMKPENILLVPNEASEVNNCEFRVKICDFGMATKVEWRRRLIKRSNWRNSDKLGDYWKGTPLYLSPEAVRNYVQDCPTDIWALGCIVLEMLTGKHPGDSTNETQDTLLKKIDWGRNVPKIPKELSKESKNFLRKCFLKNPRHRWTAAMLLDHSFITGISPGEDDHLQQQFDVVEPTKNRRKYVMGSNRININLNVRQFQGVC